MKASRLRKCSEYRSYIPAVLVYKSVTLVLPSASFTSTNTGGLLHLISFFILRLTASVIGLGVRELALGRTSMVRL